MTRGCPVVLLALAWCTLGSGAAAPGQAPATKPELEKRARVALDESDLALAAARADYQEGKDDRVAADAERIAGSVDLAMLSLDQTGKNPRKSPRWFKYAEIRTRVLLRRLTTLELDMSFADRPVIERARIEVQAVHDKLLHGLLEEKPK